MSKIIGINKRWYPGETRSVGLGGDTMSAANGWGDPVCLCTVLVEGGIGDYAAYQGIGDRPEWIAQHGDKISFTEANVHFCGALEEGKYRT